MLVEVLPYASGSWPWATFVANVAGAFMLGYVVTRLHDSAHANRRAFLGTGFCGALTTFSTLQLELLLMLDDGHYALAGAYALVSIAAGYAAVALATALVRRRRVRA